LNTKIANVTPHHLLSNSAGVRDFAAPVISNDDDALGNMVRSWKDDVFFAEQGEIYSYSSPGKNGKIDFLFTELYSAKRIKR
jgi:CubicO group peptidase (beta-lactamase class C family)